MFTPTNIGLMSMVLPLQLTGSRFFSPERDSTATDWDYFIQDDYDIPQSGEQPIRLTLEKLGFKRIDMTHYNDICITEVWRRPIGKYGCNGFQVDVQIVKDAAAKMKVQDLLNSPGFKAAYMSATKGQRAKMWDVGLKAVNAAI